MSVAELKEWKAIIKDPSSEEAIRTLMDIYWTDLENADYQSLAPEKSAAMYDQLMEQSQNASVKTRPWRWIGAAAAIIFVFSSLLLFYQSPQQSAIAPGKNTAFLTLSNGKTIRLSESKGAVILDASKLSYSDGTPLSKDTLSSGLVADAEFSITTPRGGTYEVILADGTHVWLNADSKLKFPNKFTGKQRLVSLYGEGYFEVSHNAAMPFRVLTGHQQVEVLGTHFNVNAYQNESEIKTTLIEGAVKVSEKGTSKLLSPGFQAINNDKGIEVIKVDPAISIAWKNKQFLFEGQNIKIIMRMLQRWYNVDVIYSGEITTDTFSGGVSRFNNLSEVLSSLESTGKVKFRLIGRQVYVSM
ncbi:FecR family protein [Pedobacter sp. MC2016-14]|uniref:FecR family protein n=1 Tax=Pedobacter sp. MC2016-14 TaxID=2897327 RepID=UPI001E389933|nr:FecR family protein [Pedobacter sp. MC2016-14]MCD0488102.1 FecR family protein [Pedobacter sp. MC2016-14]